MLLRWAGAFARADAGCKLSQGWSVAEPKTVIQRSPKVGGHTVMGKKRQLGRIVLR